MKQIPYGIDNYDRIIKEDYYYIDKTRFIKTVENQNSYLLFVRPRRMGKSLFVNMLMSYYDINKADQFDELFGKFWIGSHKTKWANKFLVLKLDFSKVNNELDTLKSDFTTYCLAQIHDFVEKYEAYFTDSDRKAILSHTTAKDAMVRLTTRAEMRNLQLYLFIDEYDNFSNMVLSARGVSAHEAITHGEGFYRNFFKACKGSFQRIFMTGVAPVTYDDLTSGFNIADVVALRPQFDKVMGVTETELREMIEYYRSEGAISRPTDDIIAEVKPWYDNFCFCERCLGVEPPIYNTDMVMRYMNDLVKTGFPPDEMLDINARTDTQKLNYLVLAEDLSNRELRIQTIKDICAKGYTTGRIREQFPASECGDEVNFKSMLFYFGTLTFSGMDEDYDPILRVPNKTMGELYLQYMLKLAIQEGLDLTDQAWHDLQADIRLAALNHDWQPMIDRITHLYSQYSSLRNAIRSEADVQGFLRGLLCLNKYFAIWPELELGGGYCDILLVPKATPLSSTRYSYLIEIKYMKTGQNDVDSRIAEACNQLDRYVADHNLTASHLLRDTPLTKLYLVFQGQSLVAYGVHE